MIIIYDFDGTLTPFGFPQYEILKKCGYDDNKLLEKIEKLIVNQNLSLPAAYLNTYKQIFLENNIPFTKENVCLGADKVKFNKGLLEYLEDFKTQNNNIKHYIITSGFEGFVKNTKIAKYFNGIYGTTLKSENNTYTDIDRLVTDSEKVQIIKELQKNNDIMPEKIIYLGDGLSDKNAFEYVHSSGGKVIFISPEGKENAEYKKLNALGIIDECFTADYSKNSDIYNYIKSISKEI